MDGLPALTVFTGPGCGGRVPKPFVKAGGGMAAIRYTWRKGREAGGLFKLYRRMRAKNACKTCASSIRWYRSERKARALPSSVRTMRTSG